MSNKGICELIAAIGNDSVTYQIVNNSISNIKKKRDCTEVSFLTSELTPNDVMMDSGKVGIVVWVSREDYAVARNEILEGK